MVKRTKNATLYCCCTKTIITGVLIALGLVLAVTGGIITIYFPNIYKRKLEKQLVMKRGSEAYTNWHNPPSTVYMQYYIFNYTNVDEMLAKHDVKPTVNELGPYTYRQIQKTQVLDYNEYNITYSKSSSYVFEKSMSCATCKENDMVYIPNIIAITLLKKMHDSSMNVFSQYLIDVLFKSIPHVSLFIKVTAAEVIWGYDDKLLVSLKKTQHPFSAVGYKIPDTTKVVLQDNGTVAGNLTLLTGKENIKDVMRIIRWKGLNNSPYWLTKYGNMINGTDGSRAEPYLSRDRKVYVFIPEICRSLDLRYEKDVTVEGIKLYRFVTTPTAFGNASVNPDNAAFCTMKDCCISGLLSKCESQGAPIFMSWPHFYLGDPKLAKAINGMEPKRDLHSTTMDIEPTTGITMSGYKRLQVNILAQKTFLTFSKPLPNDINILPIMYITATASIDANGAARFRKMVIFPKVVMAYLQYALIGVGCTFLFVALILTIILVARHDTSYTSRSPCIERDTDEHLITLKKKKEEEYLNDIHYCYESISANTQTTNLEQVDSRDFCQDDSSLDSNEYGEAVMT